MRGREKEREQRGRELEKKARQQADQCEYSNIYFDKQDISRTCQIFMYLSCAFHYVKSPATCYFLPVVALEEHRANLNRELSTLRHTHNKVRYNCSVSERVSLLSFVAS